MNGYGVYTWDNGMKYSGTYREDIKHGFGIFEWPDGKKYTGEWSEGK